MNVDLQIELKEIVKKYKLKSNKGVICEMLAVGVHKDFQGKGIAKFLTQVLLQNSKDKGFFISKAECSSLYSTKALVKSGATTEKSIRYEEMTI